MQPLKKTLVAALTGTFLLCSSAYASDSNTGFCGSASCQSDFAKLERMALYGSGEAATIVAVAYATGDGTEQDVKKARRHMKQAAIAWRDPMAMHQMSIWLRQGFIFEQDIDKANALLDRSAKAKYVPALTDKAKLLLTENTPEADQQAIALLEQANEQYYTPGRYLLAQLLASGVAVESDLARAGSLFKSLALAGYADSRQQLDAIITVLEHYTKQANDNQADRSLLAVVNPVLTDLKQIDDIEVIKVQGMRINLDSTLNTIVTKLDAEGIFNNSHTGSRIPGNICDRNFDCKLTYDRKKADFGAYSVGELLGNRVAPSFNNL